MGQNPGDSGGEGGPEIHTFVAISRSNGMRVCLLNRYLAKKSNENRSVPY